MRKDARANRAALLDSATRLIAEKGADVSLREIARDAEVGVATANRNFPDRITLFRAVIEHGFARLSAVLTPDTAAWDDDPWQAWCDTIHGVRDQNLSGLAEALVGHIALAPEALGDVNTKRGRIIAMVSEVFQLGVSHGFAPADLSPVRFYLGLVTASRPLPALASAIDPEAREWLTDIYIAGLRAQAADSAP